MYASLHQLREYLGVSGQGDDVLLSAFLESAQQIIERHCQRQFEACSVETRHFEVERAVDGATLFLDEDLADEGEMEVVNGDGAVIPIDQYVLEPRHARPAYAIRLRAGLAWGGSDDIAVTGRWAHSVEAPPDIVQATLRLAAFLYRQKDASAELDRPLLADNGSIVLPSRLPSDVLMLLVPYQRLL